MPVNECTLRIGHQHLLFDPALWPDISADQLTVEHWRAQGAHAAAAGRGNAWFLARPDGEHWVLRHYQRGGLIRKLSPDRYIWLGAARSRAWREFRLLQALTAAGLPVPRPVAAGVTVAALRYRQVLVTQRIADAVPLSARLAEAALDAGEWRTLGRVLAQFRDAGVGHADLNAANILWRAPDRFFLIDFDRGRQPASAAFQSRSIRRLRHSLDKFCRRQPGFHFSEADWQALLQGYGP